LPFGVVDVDKEIKAEYRDKIIWQVVQKGPERERCFVYIGKGMRSQAVMVGRDWGAAMPAARMAGTA